MYIFLYFFRKKYNEILNEKNNQKNVILFRDIYIETRDALVQLPTSTGYCFFIQLLVGVWTCSVRIIKIWWRNVDQPFFSGSFILFDDSLTLSSTHKKSCHLFLSGSGTIMFHFQNALRSHCNV